MTINEKEFPTMTLNDINFNNIREEVNAEMLKYPKVIEGMEALFADVDSTVYTTLIANKALGNSLRERYTFNNYLVDPNKFRLRKVVRIVAMVQRFVRNLKTRVRQRKNLVADVTTNAEEGKSVPLGLKDAEEGDQIVLEDQEVVSALRYFYVKSTAELKRFRDEKDFEKIAEEVENILYYKGRILLEQSVSGVKNMCDVMIDLSCRTFWMPLVDRYSPFAYSIVNEVHWHNKVAKHTGVEKTLRYTSQFAHIVEGRELVKGVRKACAKCRVLMKEQLKVVMGPVSEHNLNIAPAFYFTQVDLVGSFESYYGANKRTKMKLWIIVFCCCTTGAVDLKIMESYSSSAFNLGFKRFSSRAGFPKMLLPDHGSQLLKACEGN